MGLLETKISQLNFQVGLQVGSLSNPNDVQLAVGMIEDGEMVAAQMRAVFGIWVRADSQDSINQVLEAKKEKVQGKRPFSAMLPMHEFVPLIETDRVQPRLKDLMRNSNRLRNCAGSVTQIRAPINREEAVRRKVPDSLLSEKDGVLYLQNLCPSGHPIDRFIRSLRERNIYPAVTTLNTHTLAEVTTGEEAREACLQMGIGLLLLDTVQGQQSDIKGSYFIVNAQDGTAERDGNVPPELVERMLKFKLDRSHMKPAKYPHANYPLMEENWQPEQIRTAIILYSMGINHPEVRRRVEKMTKSFTETKR